MDRPNHLRRAMLALGILSLLVFAGSAQATLITSNPTHWYHAGPGPVYPNYGCVNGSILTWPTCMNGWQAGGEIASFSTAAGGSINYQGTVSQNTRWIDPSGGWNVGIYQSSLFQQFGITCGGYPPTVWTSCEVDWSLQYGLPAFARQDVYDSPTLVLLNNSVGLGYAPAVRSWAFCHAFAHASGLASTGYQDSCTGPGNGYTVNTINATERGEINSRYLGTTDPPLNTVFHFNPNFQGFGPGPNCCNPSAGTGHKDVEFRPLRVRSSAAVPNLGKRIARATPAQIRAGNVALLRMLKRIRAGLSPFPARVLAAS